ncbi:MAG: hypothetical protein IJZ20_03690, partial [Clostridia bacterium]|nr:hypothetical protein [Clostridia bacterium]
VANLAGMDVTWDNATKSVYLWQNMRPSDSYYLVAVASPYDSKNCSIYDADEYFYMDNVAYHSGFRLWTSSGYAQYNLQNKYSTMEVTIGHTDYFDRSKTVTFLVDGRNVGTVSLPAGCKPQRYAVNLYNGQNLKISVSGAGEVGFGNIVVK